MQLNALTEFTLILTLAFFSKSLGHKNWTVTVPRTISATRGSDVIITCTFDCPPSACDVKVQVHWKKRKGNSFDGHTKKQNEFIYHENKDDIVERYRNKTELVKNGPKDCTLRIRRVTENDQDIYLRLETDKTGYSFYDETVSISVFDKIKPSPEAETTTVANLPKNSSATIYTAIFVPIAALVIIVILVGTFCFMKQKRKQSFTREESGYYANFSRASSNNAKSEVSCKNIDTLPEINDADDPVYVNVKDPLDQMGQNLDNINNIYANVDYKR